MDRANRLVEALRAAVSSRDVQAARREFSALGAVLNRHMAWEAGTLGEHVGWIPAGGRDAVAWSLKTLQDTLRHALHAIEGFVSTPSLGVPSAYWALDGSIGRLESALESYTRGVETTYYRALDQRLLVLEDAEAARTQESWNACMAESAPQIPGV